MQETTNGKLQRCLGSGQVILVDLPRGLLVRCKAQAYCQWCGEWVRVDGRGKLRTHVMPTNRNPESPLPGKVGD